MAELHRACRGVSLLPSDYSPGAGWVRPIPKGPREIPAQVTRTRLKEYPAIEWPTPKQFSVTRHFSGLAIHRCFLKTSE
jgi:hypothetical protein